MRDFGVDDFLEAVEREVVTLRDEVGLGHAEALRGAGGLGGLAWPRNV